MARIRIVTTRAPGLIPSLIKEIDHASNPVVLIPESFTLACETEIVNRSRDKGIFGLKVFSPSSLVREVRELTGHGSKKPVSADGQNMIVSQVLHHHHDELKYYRDSIAQPTLAQKIASQINDFTRARLSADFLREFQPSSKRTQAKLEDMALVWDGYTQALGDRFEDGVGQWLSAVDNIVRSGLIRNAQLLIYGFDYLPAIQRKRNSSMDTQGKDAFDIRALRKNISESTRLLYVAMARAQQKLCLVGSVKDGEETLWSNQTRAARIWKTRSMLDMIMPAVLQRVDLPDVGETAEDDLWRVACVSGKVIEEGAEEERASASGIEEILTKEEPMLMYLPEKVEPAPLKTSVTTLTRQAPVLSDDDSEETVEDKRKTEEAVRTFRLSSVASRPAFLEEEKVEAVNVGTATHRFLRLIDLDYFRREGIDIEWAVQQEAERMRQENILTEEESGLIRLHGVAAFLKSDLGQRMLKSSDVQREANFTMRIDPHAPTMVQGIVDCAFKESGEWILIDYKTDRDTDQETFVPRHEAQMNWYRTALERLTRINVREMWLFALRAGKAYQVDRREVTE